MRECFRVCRRDVQITRAIHMMQLLVGNGSQFNHLLLNSHLIDQGKRWLSPVRARISPFLQFAGQEQTNLSTQPFPNQRQRAKQSLEISEVIVMAHVEEFEVLP